MPCRGRECPSRGQCATVDDRPHIALAPVAAGTPGAPAPLAKSHAAVSGACLHHPRHICRQTSTGLTCSCKTHPYPPRLITTTQPSTSPSKNRQLLPPTQLGPITLAGPNTTLSLSRHIVAAGPNCRKQLSITTLAAHHTRVCDVALARNTKTLSKTSTTTPPGPITLAAAQISNATLSLPAAHCSRGAQLS